MDARNRTLRMMGTVITLTIIHPQSEMLLDQAEEKLYSFQARFSANDESSDLMVLNAHAGIHPIKVDNSLFELIKIGKEMSISSNLSLNIAIGPLVKLWRIGFSGGRVPSASEIKKKSALIHPEDIILNEAERTVYLNKKGMEIDLGAIAKGYFADELKKFFLAKGVISGMIDLGGNVLTIGEKPEPFNAYWNVGIQNPQRSRGTLLAVIAIKNQSVVTSGIYERKLEAAGKNYHHIFDSATGYPIENEIASVTVVSDNSIDGEIWTTILFRQTPEKALAWLNELDHIEGIIITRDNQLYVSNHLKPRVTLIQPLDHSDNTKL